MSCPKQKKTRKQTNFHAPWNGIVFFAPPKPTSQKRRNTSYYITVPGPWSTLRERAHIHVGTHVRALSFIFIYELISGENQPLRATSHTRPRARPFITLQALSLVEWAQSVRVRFTLRLGDRRSMWMQDECKVYMDPYMVSNGSCFMVFGIVFKTTSWT
jgi:hypothetical protein